MTKIVDINGQKVEIWENVAQVMDVKIWSETSVSGGGGGGYINQNGGRINDTYITSSTSQKMQVWFRNQDGYEYYMVFSDDGLGFRADQQVKFVYGRIGSSSYSLYKLTNLATRQTKTFMDLPSVFADQLWSRYPDDEAQAEAADEGKPAPSDATVIASCSALLMLFALFTGFDALQQKGYNYQTILMMLIPGVAAIGFLAFLLHRLDLRKKKVGLPIRLSLLPFIGVYGMTGVFIAIAPPFCAFIPIIAMVFRVIALASQKKQKRQGIEARQREKTLTALRSAFAGT